MGRARERPGARLRIGLLGGSFNPAHRGHRAVSLAAIAALGLDELWWLVSPGNPLKDARTLAPFAARIRHARGVARRSRIRVSALEATMHTRFAVDTVAALQHRYPNHRFIWIMGADNLQSFHRWRGWRQIMRRVPVAVVARPGALLLSRTAPMARRFAGARRPSREAPELADMAPPAWVYLRAPLNPASSTALRARAQVARDTVAG